MNNDVENMQLVRDFFELLTDNITLLDEKNSDFQMSRKKYSS